jgi:hypothetical protein
VTEAAMTALATSPVILVLLAAWAVGEAIALPVVPDVGVGILALATPAALGWPLAAVVAGGVMGALIFASLRGTRPAWVRRLLVAQPGVGAHGLAAARECIDRVGSPRAFAQVGPGLPLKAWLDAQLDLHPSTTRLELAMLALVNRLTRIVPIVVGFTVIGLVIRPLGLNATLVVSVYVIGWVAFYAAFWWSRRAPAAPLTPSDGPR